MTLQCFMNASNVENKFLMSGYSVGVPVWPTCLRTLPGKCGDADKGFPGHLGYDGVARLNPSASEQQPDEHGFDRSPV